MVKNNINLHILNASGKLNPYVKGIRSIFDEAVGRIIGIISVSDVDVIVVDDPFSVIPEDGVGGHTSTPNLVKISIDAKKDPNLNKAFHLEFVNMMAHEFSHVARWQSIGSPYDTLLDALVTEGLGDLFAIEITKREKLHPKDMSLTKEQSSDLLNKAAKEFNSEEFSYTRYSEWFFGSKEKRIPRWTGYTLGYNLVAEYLKKNPDKRPSQLHGLKAKEFIDLL